MKRRSTLHTFYLNPINGYEYTFKDHSLGFEKNKTGSNCYSYALNHFELNGKRSHKAVPGDIFKETGNEPHAFTDWQTCDNAQKRIIDDGKTIKKLYGLNKNVIIKMKGDIDTQLKTKPKKGYRKIALVIETDGEENGIPTDFHFYAQNKSFLYQIYNHNLIVYPEQNKLTNIYNELNVNAFLSDLKLHRISKTFSPKQKKYYDKLIQNRAFYNLTLHNDIFPDYMIRFIPDPWWILNIPSGLRNIKNVKNKFFKLVPLCKNNDRMLTILIYTIFDCIKILKKKYVVENKNKPIGLWSHKLGWATKPLNTDGNGKLIFNPKYANRKHSNYDYDKICCCFEILTGWGTTSL